MKTIQTIDLKWKPIQSYKKIKRIDNREKGVYIWGFKNLAPHKNFLPYYVGRGKIKNRLRSHIINLAGGGYVIHKKNNLAKFYKFKDNQTEWIYYLNKKEEHEIDDFIDRWVDKKKRNELIESLKIMLVNFHFTYALCFEKPKILRTVETKIINEIGINKLWNRKRGVDSDEIVVNHVTNKKRIKAIEKIFVF